MKNVVQSLGIRRSVILVDPFWHGFWPISKKKQFPCSILNVENLESRNKSRQIFVCQKVQNYKDTIIGSGCLSVVSAVTLKENYIKNVKKCGRLMFSWYQRPIISRSLDFVTLIVFLQNLPQTDGQQSGNIRILYKKCIKREKLFLYIRQNCFFSMIKSLSSGFSHHRNILVKFLLLSKKISLKKLKTWIGAPRIHTRIVWVLWISLVEIN